MATAPVSIGGSETEILLWFLARQRAAVRGKLTGVEEGSARWCPVSGANSILGVINHLAFVERRWVAGVFGGGPFERREEVEFWPPEDRTVADVLADYEAAAAETDACARAASLEAPAVNAQLLPLLNRPGAAPDDSGWPITLRWVLLHLIEETARHAGQVDVTRQLLDGTVGL